MSLYPKMHKILYAGLPGGFPLFFGGGEIRYISVEDRKCIKSRTLLGNIWGVANFGEGDPPPPPKKTSPPGSPGAHFTKTVRARIQHISS